jgi:hypothetical protein
MPWIMEKRYFSLDDPREPLSPPSHAAASVPMGGYAFSSTVTRGVHVHHSEAGTWFMTPETCLPQPHHVILSVGESVSVHVCASRGTRKEDSFWWCVGLRKIAVFRERTACVASCLLAHIGERVFFFEPLCWVGMGRTAR